MVALAALPACLLPSDSSGKLRISVQGIPAILFVGDSIEVEASVLDAAGAQLTNADLRFTTDNPVALEIRALGGRRAQLLARLAEPATLRVVALSYDLVPVTLNLSIKLGVSIDSIVPSAGRWGDTIVAYGAGLDSLNLIHFHVDGIPTHPVMFEGLAPRPDRYGKVVVLIPALARSNSPTEAIAQSGSASGPPVTVTAPEDRYEPNDTAPADLGSLPDEFHNPALALERRPRGDVRPATDWYRFTNATTQDRTILVMGAATNGTGLLISGGTVINFLWDQAGVASICAGFNMRAHSVGDTLALALKSLPAGTYDLVIDYPPRAQDRPYELMIMPRYVSVLPPDAAEGNDFCDAARPVTVGAAAQPLSIDRPTDDDWFKFSVGAGGQTLRFLLQFADTNDIDFRIYRNFLPDSVVYYAISASGDPRQEDGTFTLPQGNYLLHIYSYLEEPVEYSLTITPVPAAAGAAAVPQTSAWPAKRRSPSRRRTPVPEWRR